MSSHRTTKRTGGHPIKRVVTFCLMASGWLAGGAAAAPPSPDYELAWSDEFSGDSLNREAWSYRTDVKWDTAHRPENVKVSGGKLRLVLEKRANDGKQFTTGGVVTKRSFRYGYFEARMKGFPDGNWHPSFWTAHALGLQTMGNLPPIPHLGGSEAPRLEIDIVEHDTANVKSYHAGLLRWGPQGTGSLGRKHFTVPDLSAAFNVFGAAVMPDRVDFYFNDKLVNSVPMAGWPQPEGFVFLTSIGRQIVSTRLPGEIQFDWFRYYARRSDVPKEYKFENVETGKLLRTADLSVLPDAALEARDDENLFRRDAWQWIPAENGRGRLRNSWSSMVVTGNAGAGSGQRVVVDFNDLKIGGMRSVDGQVAGTGTGFGEDFWVANTGVPRVVDGDLTAPATTHYAISQTGAGRSMEHTSFSSDRLQARALKRVLTGTVWFSFLLRVEDANDRLGIAFNRGTAFDNLGTRIQCVGGNLVVGSEGKLEQVANAFSLAATHLVVGRLSLGGGTVAKDKLAIWVNPVLLPGETLGTPVYNQEVNMLPQGGSAIESLHLVGYGATAISGRMDSVRMSDASWMIGLEGGKTGSTALAEITGVPAYEPADPAKAAAALGTSWAGNDPRQEWELADAAGGSVRIRQASGLVLRASGSGIVNQVTLSPESGHQREQWIARLVNGAERVLYGAAPLPNGWLSTWLGEVEGSRYPWLFHRDLGWVFAAAGTGNEVRLWHHRTGWLGTSAAAFPWVYQVADESWGVMDLSREPRLWNWKGTDNPLGPKPLGPVNWVELIEAADYSSLGAAPADPPVDPPSVTWPSSIPPVPMAANRMAVAAMKWDGDKFWVVAGGELGRDYRLEVSQDLNGGWTDSGIRYHADGRPRVLGLPIGSATGFVRVAEE